MTARAYALAAADLDVSYPSPTLIYAEALRAIAGRWPTYDKDHGAFSEYVARVDTTDGDSIRDEANKLLKTAALEYQKHDKVDWQALWL